MLRRALTAAAAAVLTGTVLAVPAPANAATCATYYNYNRNGERIAQLCDSDARLGHGNWTLQSRGDYRGVNKKMVLKVCEWDNSGDHNCHSDSGMYSYYAGPIADPGGCQHLYVRMWDGRGNRILHTSEILCN
jgi:hypothetical protein